MSSTHPRQRDRESDRLARVTLTALMEPGDPHIAALVAEIGAGPVVDLVRDDRRGWKQGELTGPRSKGVDPAAELDRAEKQGIRFVCPGDDEWPEGLAGLQRCLAQQECGGAPVGLWLKGRLSLAEASRSAIAVVGSRSATSYGLEQASQISSDLAAEGMSIVSGAAYGIDQAAHRGALAAGGVTVAVLPCGVDRAYPAAHADLLTAISDKGLLISESPPGTVASRTRFLARNRIIAGLSEGTVVVEAATRSGALGTAGWATQLSRPVMAVPGPISSITSEGVHRLMRAGQATIVTSAQDVLDDVGVRSAPMEPNAEAGDHGVHPARPRDLPNPGQTRDRAAPSR